MSDIFKILNGGVIDVIGYLGSFLIILAYLLISFNKLKSSSSTFQVLNLVGGALVLCNSWFYGAFPSVLISVFWILIASYSIYKNR
jgi:hypothetical protein